MPADPSTLSRFDKAGYYMTNLALRGVIGAAMLLPYHRRLPMVARLVSLVAPLVGWTKRIRNNLAIACPDLPESEVKRLCRAVPENAGRMAMELYSGQEFLDRTKDAPINGPGLDAFLEARKAGRPVMLITAHLGNYDAIRAVFFPMGHPIGALYRRMANPYFNDHYVEKLKSIGEPMFEQGRRGMSQMVRHLKGGGLIAIVSDLHVHGGEELTFFGQPAVTSIMNAELALKYDALVIPIYAIRQPNGLDFEILMKEPLEHTDPVTMTQALNDDLEAVVREHMDQWFWIHRRWKPWNDKGLPQEELLKRHSESK